MPNLTVKLPGFQPVTHSLGEGSIVIGRAVESDLQILHGLVSKRHATIEKRGSEFHIRDLESHNGTFVNNQRVRDAVLRPGDQIKFGIVESVFEVNPDDPSLASAPTVAIPKVSEPGHSISTKDLPQAPQDDEPAPAPAPAPVAVKPAPSEKPPAPAPAPVSSKRTPLPKPDPETLRAKVEPQPPVAGTKAPAKPVPTQPAAVPKPEPQPKKPAPKPAADFAGPSGFEPRPVRRREPMPTWLFLLLGVGIAACAAGGVWFWLSSANGNDPLAALRARFASPADEAVTVASPTRNSNPPTISEPGSEPVQPPVSPDTAPASETPAPLTSSAPETRTTSASSDPNAIARQTISAVDAPAIGAMLRDPSENIRRSAARALHALGSDAAGARDDLQGALKDEDAETRLWSALALAQIDRTNQAAVPVLIEGLKNPSAEVREAAALSVSMIQFSGDQSQPVIELLTRMSVEDADERVRRAASSASKLLNAKLALQRDA